MVLQLKELNFYLATVIPAMQLLFYSYRLRGQVRGGRVRRSGRVFRAGKQCRCPYVVSFMVELNFDILNTGLFFCVISEQNVIKFLRSLFFIIHH